MNANPYNLTPAQMQALERAESPSGACVGECGSIHRASARVLQRLGLIVIMPRQVHGARRLRDWAFVTPAGQAEVDRRKAELKQHRDNILNGTTP